MKAMILAAGEGKRMRPLTLNTPKPLLKVGDRTLLEYHLLNLRSAGFTDIVVNAAYLADQIVTFCGDGSRWGLNIQVSVESEPLETAGGIIKALPLLGDAPFLLLNGDTWFPFPFETLTEVTPRAGGLHLVLVDNPDHNPEGDFSLLGSEIVSKRDLNHTYSGLGVFDASIFRGYTPTKLALKPFIDRAVEHGLATGEYWPGIWKDIGTPERLKSVADHM